MVLLTAVLPPDVVVSALFVTELLPSATEFATFAVEPTPMAMALVVDAVALCANATEPEPDAVAFEPKAVA
ncbi:hypothetical protein [Burkholderia sp. LMG 32019]|uniref:hypothetical protein n=1 Tax=Burkholderia sp. LMG 32019 TaxID=3158173 RepID=UPI003C2C0B41